MPILEMDKLITDLEVKQLSLEVERKQTIIKKLTKKPSIGFYRSRFR